MKFYKVADIAEMLQCDPSTVKAEIHRGRLEAFKNGSEWRITEQALEKYTGVVLNNYKTERELRLEQENEELKQQLSIERGKLLKISQIFLQAQ